MTWAAWILVVGCGGGDPPPSPEVEPDPQPAWLVVRQHAPATDPAFPTLEAARGLDAIRRALARRLEVVPENWCLDDTAPMGPVMLGQGVVRGTLPLGTCEAPDPAGAVAAGDGGNIDPSPEDDDADAQQTLATCAENEGTDDWDPVACTLLVAEPDGVDPGTVYVLDDAYVYSRLCPEGADDDDPRCTVLATPVDGLVDPPPLEVTVTERCEDIPELCRIPVDMVRARPPAKQTVPCDENGTPLEPPNPEWSACMAECEAIEAPPPSDLRMRRCVADIMACLDQIASCVGLEGESAERCRQFTEQVRQTCVAHYGICKAAAGSGPAASAEIRRQACMAACRRDVAFTCE